MNRSPSRRAVFEAAAFLGFAGVLAVGMAFLLRPKVPESAQPTVARTKADALHLSAALGLNTHEPTIVEFMDFQCPPCRASYPQIKAILKEHPNTAYRAVNFPLRMHPYAFGAAVAAEIARAHGQHERVFDDLFTGNVDLDPSHLNAYLQKKHLPPVVGKSGSAPYNLLVERERKLGEELHIEGTPTVLVLSRDGSLTEIHDFSRVSSLLN